MWFHIEKDHDWHHDPSWDPTHNSMLSIAEAPGTTREDHRWSRLFIAECGLAVVVGSGNSMFEWGWMDDAGAGAWIATQGDRKCPACQR